MGNTLTVEKLVAGPPSDVQDLWISADGMARWWWPHIPDTSYRVDAVAGGSYRIESEMVGIGVEGEYISVEPGELLLTWRWLTDGTWQVEEPLTIHFSAVDGATLVTVTHELDDLAGDGSSLAEGWEDVLNRLAGLFD